MSPNRVYKTFGMKLKELRKDEKLTQEEFAEKMQVSKTTIVNYENGNRKVPLEMVLKISCYFNVPVDSLLNFENENISHIKQWNDEFKGICFTDNEFYFLKHYAHYLLYLREAPDNVKTILEE